MTGPRFRAPTHSLVLGPAVFLVLAFASAAAAPRAEAHIVPVGLGIQVVLRLTPTVATIEYNLGYSALAGLDECLRMEKSGNDIIEKEEIEAYMSGLEPALRKGLVVEIDGKRLEFKLRERRALGLFPGTNVKDPARSFEFDTWWYFDADVDLGPGEHKALLRDDNFRTEICQTILYLPKPSTDFRNYYFDPGKVRYFDVGTDWQFYGREVALVFEFFPKVIAEARAQRAALAGTGTEPGPAPAPAAPVAPAAPSGAAAAFADAAAKAAAEGKTLEPGGGAAGGAARIGPVPGTGASGAPRKVERPGAEEDLEGRALGRLIDDLKRKGDLWTWLICLALALVYGAQHALQPGHGKSMVAAYLLGTQGRIRDAFALGGIVTLTHTGSIFIIGLGVFYIAERFGMSKQTGQGVAAFWLEVVSGVIIGIAGIIIFTLRTQGKLLGHGHSHGAGGHSHGLFGGHRAHAYEHPHAHPHELREGHSHSPGPSHPPAHGHEHAHDHANDHAHSHPHAHEPSPVPAKGSAAGHGEGERGAQPEKVQGLWAVGVASGIAPCPAGLFLVLVSLVTGLLWKGLALLLAFSLGLGLVLVAIAIVMVTSRSFLKLEHRVGPVARVLPFVSPVILFFLGGYIVVDAFRKNPDVVHYLLGT